MALQSRLKAQSRVSPVSQSFQDHLNTEAKQHTGWRQVLGNERLLAHVHDCVPVSIVAHMAKGLPMSMTLCLCQAWKTAQKSSMKEVSNSSKPKHLGHTNSRKTRLVFLGKFL